MICISDAFKKFTEEEVISALGLLMAYNSGYSTEVGIQNATDTKNPNGAYTGIFELMLFSQTVHPMVGDSRAEILRGGNRCIPLLIRELWLRNGECCPTVDEDEYPPIPSNFYNQVADVANQTIIRYRAQYPEVAGVYVMHQSKLFREYIDAEVHPYAMMEVSDYGVESRIVNPCTELVKLAFAMYMEREDVVKRSEDERIAAWVDHYAMDFGITEEQLSLGATHASIKHCVRIAGEFHGLNAFDVFYAAGCLAFRWEHYDWMLAAVSNTSKEKEVLKPLILV